MPRFSSLQPRTWLLVLFSALLFPAACTFTRAPYNIADLKSELRAYKESGRYLLDFSLVVEDAKEYLQNHPTKIGRHAIVLDVDETALSNWTAISANDFGFIVHGPCNLPQGPCGLGAWIEKAEAAAIKQTLDLYQWAREKGFKVFFISGRPELYRAATKKNLRNAGYEGWAGLFMKPDDAKFPSIAIFKSRMRCNIIEKGYKILANIGDQRSDLEGGCAEKTFLLPNPFYRIP